MTQGGDRGCGANGRCFEPFAQPAGRLPRSSCRARIMKPPRGRLRARVAHAPFLAGVALLGLRGQARAAMFFFAARGVDLAQDLGDIGRGRFWMVDAGQGRIRLQVVGLIERPHLAPIVGGGKGWGKAPKERREMIDVAHKKGRGIVVGGGVQVLGQVDDDRARIIQEDVVFAEVAMDDARAQHACHIAHEGRMDGGRLGGCQDQVGKAWRGISGGIHDKLHEQHAVYAEIGRGHAYADIGKPKERIHFGILPDLLPLVTPETRFFGHRPPTPAVAHGSPLLVESGLAEAPLAGLLIDLGAAHAVRGRDDEQIGLLAAAHGLDHVVDEPIFQQGRQGLGNAQG